MVLMIAPIAFLAFSFRVAIKSTAIIWLPLLWIIYQSQPGANVFGRMSVNIKAPWSRVMLTYSLFVIAGFVAKLFLLFHVWELNTHWRGIIAQLTIRLAEPLYLPLWQVASAINAILAWAVFFRVKQHLLAKSFDLTFSEVWVRREYVVFQAVRTTLSLYAITCTFYILAAMAWQTEWPAVHIILFPWSPRPGS
jgi:hypothetical protein